MKGTEATAQRIAELGPLDDPTRVLFERTVQAIRESHRDDEIAETLRSCAIPRHVDAVIVGVLRNAPAEVSRNEEVMSVLAALPFVAVKTDGSLAFHDSLRDKLLDDWRSAEGQVRERFEAISRRLVEHYTVQHDAALQLDRDMAAVGPVLKKTAPERRAQLLAIVEAKLRDPLLEAIYHATLVASHEGYSLFERAFEAHERSMRFTLCRALVAETQVDIVQLHAGEEAGHHLRWLRYWDARLLRSTNRFDEAEEALHTLAADVGGDAKLELWVAAELGLVLYQAYRLREALEVQLHEAAVADSTRVDPVNIPTSHIRLGGLYLALGELNHAVDTYETAVTRAEEVDNWQAIVHGSLGLAGALIGRGDRRAAVAPCLRAFDLARTALRQDRGVHLAVAGQFMDLLAPLEPSLLDTVWTEARELAGTMGDPLVQVQIDNRYVGLLSGTGQVARAEEALVDLKRTSAACGEPAMDSDVELTEALLREELGQLEAAIAGYDRICESPDEIAAEAWNRTAAISNRGHDRSQLGRWDDAEMDLRRAQAAWEEMGNESLAALMKAWLAEIAFRRGHLDPAAALLADATTTLVAFGGQYEADCHAIRSEILEAEGRWEGALEARTLALERQTAHGEFNTQGLSLGRIAALEGLRGCWEEAASWSKRAADHWEHLSERNSYRRPEFAEKADAENARAALRFSEGEVDGHEALARARDFLRSACQGAPENFWYKLNHSHVCAALEEYGEAAEALTNAIAAAPDLLGDAPQLYERLAEYRWRQGRQLYEGDAYLMAADVFDKARTALESKVPPPSLLRLIVGRGDVLLKQGYQADAGRHYEEALSLAQDDRSARSQCELRLGIVAAHESDAEAAATRFTEALALADEETETFWTLLEACALLAPPTEPPDALRDALRRLLLDPDIGGRMTRFTPKLSLPLPDGWTAKESLTIVAPDGQANLVASSEPVLPEITSRGYADAVGETLSAGELPSFHELAFGPTVLADGREAWLRRFEWEPEDAPAIVQTQLYLVDGDRGYTATATSTRTESARYDLELEQLITAISVAS